MTDFYRRRWQHAGAAGVVVGWVVMGAFTAHGGVIPAPDHVVIVIEENHAEQQIIGNVAAPYMNFLAAGGAHFTNSYAIEHPSQPNYLDLFSGSSQGVTDNSVPHTFSTPNLGAALIAKGLTFKGYSESLDAIGSTADSAGGDDGYQRKHNPWVNFTNVPNGTTVETSSNLRFADFPSDYSTLPTVSIVVPNQLDDIHNGTIEQGDTWLSNNLSGYATWAKAHNSLLILTFDEDDYLGTNQIPTVFYGANIVAGDDATVINHFSVLRTIEDMYGLTHSGAAAGATPITTVFTPEPPAMVLVGMGFAVMGRRHRRPGLSAN